MDVGLIAFLSSVGGYLTVAGGVYRRQYIKTFKEWRRWQAADPQGDGGWAGEYNMIHRTRAKVRYYEYVAYKANTWAPWMVGPLWLPVLLFLGMRWVLHPEVKVPDYPKIKELENLDGS